MSFPTIDSQDYVTNPERSEPINTPSKIYVVYYLGLNNKWIWSLPTFYLENAQKHASSLDRPTHILTYDLSEKIEVSEQDRLEWNPDRNKPKRRVRQPTFVPKMKRVRRLA
jgi:hypothetical protein